jgi:hypothetical protein
MIQLNEFWEDPLENQEHGEQKYFSLCVSKRYFVCLLCNQKIPIGNTACTGTKYILTLTITAMHVLTPSHGKPEYQWYLRHGPSSARDRTKSDR